MFRIDRSKAQYHAARRAETFMTALHKRNNRLIRACFENRKRRLRSAGGFLAMSDSVYRRDQNSIPRTAN